MKETLEKSKVEDKLCRPIRDLRISVTDKCNLRCTYCMPEEQFGDRHAFLRRRDLLSFEEIERVARLFVLLGVTKIRLTGGEPLLRRGLAASVERLLAIEGVEDLALTTNGILLPRWAVPLWQAGLSRLTVSLDSLDDQIFGAMNGRNISAQKVLEGIEAAKDAGFTNIKINAVVQRGVNDHTVVELAEHFRDTGCVLRFIEYMDVGNQNGWRLDEVVSQEELVERINARFPLRPIAKNYLSEVVNRYEYEDGAGEIGFISSVTQSFCEGCTRARLSAAGQVYTCLFAETGTDLRGPMRDGESDEALLERIRQIWTQRSDRYSELRASQTESAVSRNKVEMFHIGG